MAIISSRGRAEGRKALMTDGGKWQLPSNLSAINTKGGGGGEQVREELNCEETLKGNESKAKAERKLSVLS